MKAQEIGVFEAKTKFSELIAKVQRGQVFKITRRGRPVACLMAEEPQARNRREQKPTAWELFLRIQKSGPKLSAQQLDKLVRENRRELLARTEKPLR